jgi:hypothetical protein
VDRYVASGMDPRKAGKARGHIPNFAEAPENKTPKEWRTLMKEAGMSPKQINQLMAPFEKRAASVSAQITQGVQAVTNRSAQAYREIFRLKGNIKQNRSAISSGLQQTGSIIQQGAAAKKTFIGARDNIQNNIAQAELRRVSAMNQLSSTNNLLLSDSTTGDTKRR